MPFFRALGLGITIIVLRLLVPAVFSHMESTAIAFLNGAQVSAESATQLAASVQALPASTSHQSFQSAFSEPTLPQAAYAR